MPLRFISGVTQADISRLQDHILYLSSDDPLNNGATEYNGVNIMRFNDNAAAREPCWRAAEADVRQRLPFDISIIYAGGIIDAPPGVGRSWAFTLRNGGIDTAVTLTFAGLVQGDTWFAAPVNLTAGYMSWKCVPTNAPNAAAAHLAIFFRRNFTFS